MSHVDEGTIHAWLDGAFAPDDPERARIEQHLAECEACRSTAETERRVRERAGEVLGAAAPDAVRVEPFEKILAARRARAAEPGAPTAAPAAAGGADAAGGEDPADGPADQPRTRFRMPMALAATLVLALGATWFARQLMPRSSTMADSVPEMQAPDEGRVSSRLEADVAPPPALADPAGVEAERVPPSGLPARAAEPPAAPPAATTETGDRAAPPVAAVGAAVAGSTAANARANQAAPPPTAADERRRTPDETRRLAESALLDRLVVTGRPASEFADADALAALDRLLARNEVPWVPADMDTVAARFGTTPLTLGEAAADSVQIGTVGTAAVARLVYRVDGRPVELLQWVSGSLDTGAGAGAFRQRREVAEEAAARADVAAKAVAPASPGVYRLGGIDFLLRGAMPADSLAALAGRVTAGT